MMSGTTPVIFTHDLMKSFGRVQALDGLNFNVEAGEIHGFLGPNGAGKSTTIRILLGLLRSDGGTVKVCGQDPWRDAVSLHKRLAYVPGDVELWPNLTGGETIDMMLQLRGQYNQRRRDTLIERFDLDPRKKNRTYSKGNRQKVALVAALASHVDLLLLDEPTAGLDPLMEVVFQEVIREEQREGRSVLLSSHILAQVEALSDQISIIRHGKIVESGTLSDLRHMTRTTVVVETDHPADSLATLPGVHNLRVEVSKTTFDVDGDTVPHLMPKLTSLGVRSLVAHPPTLEQLLMRHYGTATDGITAAGAGTSPSGNAPEQRQDTP